MVQYAMVSWRQKNEIKITETFPLSCLNIPATSLAFHFPYVQLHMGREYGTESTCLPTRLFGCEFRTWRHKQLIGIDGDRPCSKGFLRVLNMSSLSH